MKKLIVLFSISLLLNNIYSQKLYTVSYYKWSDHATFLMSPPPFKTGHGKLSDSLSKAHPDTTFYQLDGDYYPITSWADYYFWYVKKYWYEFINPEVYEFFYHMKNDYGMAKYICSENFIGEKYPSGFVLSFPDKEVDQNLMNRTNMKNPYYSHERGYYQPNNSDSLHLNNSLKRSDHNKLQVSENKDKPLREKPFRNHPNRNVSGEVQQSENNLNKNLENKQSFDEQNQIIINGKQNNKKDNNNQTDKEKKNNDVIIPDSKHDNNSNYSTGTL